MSRNSLIGLASLPLLILGCQASEKDDMTQAQAQAVDCTDISEWSATTIYQAGDRMTYQGSLYQANSAIWNAPPNYCMPCGWYTLLGTCGGTPADSTPPSVPAGLTASSVTSSSVTLTWNASTDEAGGSGVAGYSLYRNGTILASPTATSYTDTNLTANTTYSYAVAARDVAENVSALSAAISVTTSSGSSCSTLPSAPSGLASSNVTSSSANLSWTAADPGANCTITSYIVYQNGSQLAALTGTSTTVTGLSASTTYSFEVAAVNSFGTGPQSAALSVTTAGGGSGGKVTMAYFTQWGIYARSYYVKNIDTSGSAAKLNIINYAFNNVVNNRCSVGVTATGVGDAWADYQKGFDAATSVDGVADAWDQPLKGNWNQLKKLKAKYPNLKVVMSLGGWTWSDGFYTAAQPANRAAFVASCIDAYIKGNLPVDAGSSTGGTGAAAGVFDGIDIDWEYPGVCGNNPGCGASSADKANFTALLAEFRKQLDAVRPGLLLTAAVVAGEDKIPYFDIPGISQYLDYINIMTYDFFGAWAAAGPTAFHSPLYAWAGMPSGVLHYYSDYAVQLWKNGGAPAEKLLLGIGFYGRGWTGVTNANNGLNQPAAGPAPGTYESGVEDYRKLSTLGYPAFTTSDGGAAWIFNGSTFWSFDTPATIETKMSYVKKQGLGGAFAWSLDGDTATGTLMTALKNGLQ